ncbi:glycine cleavage system protein GcvH [soil metagenome]
MSDVPEDRRYTRQHEWALEEEGAMTVGITDFAQDQLGDVVFVELPEPGSTVEAEKPLGEVESTKSVSDIYSPVSGKVLAKNADVETNPALINEDPYGSGWLVKIEPAGEGAPLLDAAAYRAVLEEE